MNRKVGIDAVAVYVPRLYLDLTKEWAVTRAAALGDGNVEKLIGKVTDGVGVRRMSIADAHQDCATLAAMAAKRVIDAAGIDPRDIDYIAVGTETTVDQSKSIAAYVLGMLERHYGVRLDEVGAPQVQFACIGATYALEAAVSRIRARDNIKPYSLVIASDISKYPLGSPGEYTQGAGAVALLVCEDPRLLVLEQGLSATVTRDERDFFRPNWTASAVVDGKYSIDVYLDCMQAACSGYVTRAAQKLGISSGDVYDAVDYFLFHVPFPRMAEYAALRVFSELWLADPRARQRIEAEIPMAGAPPPQDARPWRKELERALSRTSLFRDAFAKKVEPSLSLSRDVGNIYSGALYLALVSLMERTRDVDMRGKRIVLGSYGSGASAKILSGIVADRYTEIVKHFGAHEELVPTGEGGGRVALGVDDYERLHAMGDSELDLSDAIAEKLRVGAALTKTESAQAYEALQKPAWRVRARGASVLPPRGEFALERLGTTTSPQITDLGYRYYKWVNE